MEIGPQIEQREKEQTSLTYHHARPLEFSAYDLILPQRRITYEPEDEYPEKIFSWLEERLGFYPLFMAVGRTQTDRYMTGYQTQFDRRLLNQGAVVENNLVLFSYQKPPPRGIYTDYHIWERDFYINDIDDFTDNRRINLYETMLTKRVQAGELTEDEAQTKLFAYIDNLPLTSVTKSAISSLFRPSWNHNDWVSYANRNPHSVQYVVPQLDLRDADLVVVRNKETEKEMKNRGFSHVVVERTNMADYRKYIGF